jgi:hypothetical protein
MWPSSKLIRVAALAAAIATLAGCSEYLDRRDTISLGGGDSIATDKVTQMVDPWPRASADRNIAFNGAKMETAVVRYRTNTVYPPQGTGTSANSAAAGPSSSSAAAVK